MIKIIKKKIDNYLKHLFYRYIGELFKLQSFNEAIVQKNLMTNILHASDQNVCLNIHDYGFRNYSQHDEDGLLLFIFALIGTTNRKSVEICSGNGMECNTTNLIVNHRWNGLLIDGNEKNVQCAIDFFKNHPDTRHWKPKIIQYWITAENVNNLLEDNDFMGEIDLLSLDIDGIDYWLWNSIEVIQPRVVVLEFNHLWGPHKSVTVPYNPNFKAEFTQYGSDYAGASLSAFVKLAAKKGYRLVATNNISTNAFFVRNDIIHPLLPKIKPTDCFNHPRAKFGMKHRLPMVKEKNWIEI